MAETLLMPRHRHHRVHKQGEGTRERLPYPPLQDAPLSEQDLQPVGFLHPGGGAGGYLHAEGGAMGYLTRKR